MSICSLNLQERNFKKYGKKIKALARNRKWHAAASNYIKRYILSTELNITALATIRKQISNDYEWFKDNNLLKVWKKSKLLFKKIEKNILSEISEYYSLPTCIDEFRNLSKFKIYKYRYSKF